MTAAQGEALRKDAARIKWVPDRALELAANARGSMSLLQAEVAVSLADVSLAVVDHPLLTKTSVLQLLMKPHVQSHAVGLANLLLRRFDASAAPLSHAALLDALEERDAMVEEHSDGPTRQLLHTMGSAVKNTLRTNVYDPERWALTLRLEPDFFVPALPPAPPNSGLSNLPYGVFFCTGRSFNGYHVRFSDIARGGMRVVLPPSMETYVSESARHFNECFSLAWAQHLKNKDIAEGGAKAVCLVKPSEHEDRAVLLHRCVKAFSDGVLDLLVDPKVPADGRGAESSREVIYFGPDENITPVDIDWVIQRAGVRNYVMPAAFMSSKPREGINHKEFGVTSEGVAVFLAEALKAINIRPHSEPWSIKMTGGPDGDVCGNMIKILDRDYGHHVRIVGLADGSGCAEDPAGLPMQELLRLFELGLPISEMRREMISPSGVVTLADTPEGAALRNTMHNRVQADAFVPAGGRPSTIHAGNWQQFLTGDGGTPSCKVVVEGANLFLTPEARLALFQHHGLPIIKDSSANKCGVVCSSLEIVASMVLSSDEFIDLKPKYVEQVLERLRELARLEATMLFRESARDPTRPLPSISEEISFHCLRVSTALSSLLDRFDQPNQHRLWPLVKDQLPAVIFEQYAERLPKRVPWEYVKAVIASGLGSRMVYREGLAFVANVSDAQLPSFALAYLQQEQRVRALASEIASSGISGAKEAEQLLLRGGVRAAAEGAYSVPRKAP